MGRLLQALGLQEAATPSQVVEVAELESKLHHASTALENFARAELMKEDRGWVKLTEQAANDFTREGRQIVADLNRVMFMMNPLIKRGGNIRAAYVWGQGVEIQARDEDLNEVVQAFLDDEGNREAFTGHQARIQHENALYTDGNYFLANFTNPLTGRVQVRDLPFDEIQDVITDPGDRTKPWYYLRQWTESQILEGVRSSRQMKAYYPALKFQPATRQKRINGIDVYWDSPVKHVKVNALSGWKFGIGDAYAAVPWARAHKEFLEDWAILCKALSRIAYQTSSAKVTDSQRKRAEMAKLNELGAGNNVSMSENNKLEAVSKSGATLDSESSHPLMVMVSMAIGVPVTVLSGDPGKTGARATAETLDMPTRLEMQGRQEVHAEAYKDILSYVIEQAVIAPRGPIKGTTVRDGDRLYAQPAGDPDQTLEVIWPDLEEQPLDIFMAALEKAENIGGIPNTELLYKLVLRALKVKDVDDILDEMRDENGEILPPDLNAGQAVIDRFRNGQDPAEAMR